MAKKKKHEEHENLERWLVSYADFMTLLFATFVVLYALAQTDVSELAKIDEALQRAFSRNAILQGQDGLMDGSQNIFDSQNGKLIYPRINDRIY
jgi:chemotaxis protein MotB